MASTASEAFESIVHAITVTRVETHAIDAAHAYLRKGGDINRRDSDSDSSLLEIACHVNYLDLARVLLEAGIDIDATTHPRVAKDSGDGKHPLGNSAYMGYLSMVQLLHRHGADLNSRRTDGSTALHVAAAGGKLDVIAFLHQNGADVSSVSLTGATPLMLASIYGHIRCVRYLRRNGAIILQQDINRADALYYACDNGHVDVAQYLTEHGGDVNLSAHDGFSPLWVACQHGHEKVVMYLLARGADINKCTETGHSPITIAHMQGHRNIVKLLHVAGAIVSDRLSAETGFKTKVKDLVLAIGDDTDVRETCANEDCAKVEAAYGDYSACASCKLVYYCSKECQVSAWRSHKKQCKKDAAAMVASKLAE